MLNGLSVLIACEDINIYTPLTEELKLESITTIQSPADCMSIEISILRYEPDILLLDADELDFVQLQRLLKNIDLLEKKPYILAISSYEDSDKDNELLSNGVAECIKAPFVMSDLYRLIKDYKDSIPVDKSRLYSEINKNINDMLTLFRLHSGIQGYNYIRKAIFISILNNNSKLNFSKNIYPEIAQTFDTNTACVEWAIRSAISRAWKLTADNVKYFFFPLSKLKNHSKPTNNEFITTLANIIHNEFAELIDKSAKQADIENCSSPS